MEPCFVLLDTFGFSRGACVARDFANHVKDGAIEFAGRKAEVIFMGLWDSVSSIGKPGNTGDWPDENVRIRGSAWPQGPSPRPPPRMDARRRDEPARASP